MEELKAIVKGHSSSVIPGCRCETGGDLTGEA